MGRRHDYTAALSRIASPVTMVYGTSDTGGAAMFDQYRTIPGLESIELSGGDHFIAYDVAQFPKAVAPFLNEGALARERSAMLRFHRHGIPHRGLLPRQPSEVKTLRYYHEIGILEPAGIDPMTGYRWYDEESLRKAALVKRVRELDFSLEEIADIARLEADGRTDEGLARLAAKARELDERIERFQRIKVESTASSPPTGSGGGRGARADRIDRDRHATRREARLPRQVLGHRAVHRRRLSSLFHRALSMFTIFGADVLRRW